jgi:hypothetical protein
MVLLEVFIPTYKRPHEFAACLNSLKEALVLLPRPRRSCVGVAINNNTTLKFSEYHDLVAKFKSEFSSLGVAYFDYSITGFNIGSVNNIVGGLMSAKAKYVWLLPDDDLARFDSLKIATDALEAHSPSFLSGGWVKKSVIHYGDNGLVNDDGAENRIHDVIEDRRKVAEFLSSNVVQAQEYIYNVAFLRRFLEEDSNIELLNEMFPGLFGIFCMQFSGPFVRLERSIGIFRDSDPNSEWRHLWLKFALIDWPLISERCQRKGWLDSCEKKISEGVFRSVFKDAARRPDILLGLNRRYRLNPLTLIKYHGFEYIQALIRIPCAVISAVQKKLSASRSK